MKPTTPPPPVDDAVWIPLTKGMWSLIDEEDYLRVSLHSWSFHHTGYARARIATHEVYLHHFIFGKTLVDHIDRNKLNNRKSNLRKSTPTQNNANANKRGHNKSGYKGVCWDKSKNKWMASIRISNRGIFLGRFENKEDAARAYDEAARKYFKEFARTNF